MTDIISGESVRKKAVNSSGAEGVSFDSGFRVFRFAGTNEAFARIKCPPFDLTFQTIDRSTLAHNYSCPFHFPQSLRSQISHEKSGQARWLQRESQISNKSMYGQSCKDRNSLSTFGMNPWVTTQHSMLMQYRRLPFRLAVGCPR